MADSPEEGTTRRDFLKKAAWLAGSLALREQVSPNIRETEAAADREGLPYIDHAQHRAEDWEFNREPLPWYHPETLPPFNQYGVANCYVHAQGYIYSLKLLREDKIVRFNPLPTQAFLNRGEVSLAFWNGVDGTDLFGLVPTSGETETDHLPYPESAAAVWEQYQHLLYDDDTPGSIYFGNYLKTARRWRMEMKLSLLLKERNASTGLPLERVYQSLREGPLALYFSLPYTPLPREGGIFPGGTTTSSPEGVPFLYSPSRTEEGSQSGLPPSQLEAINRSAQTYGTGIPVVQLPTHDPIKFSGHVVTALDMRPAREILGPDCQRPNDPVFLVANWFEPHFAWVVGLTTPYSEGGPAFGGLFSTVPVPHQARLSLIEVSKNPEQDH